MTTCDDLFSLVREVAVCGYHMPPGIDAVLRIHDIGIDDDDGANANGLDDDGGDVYHYHSPTLAILMWVIWCHRVS